MRKKSSRKAAPINKPVKSVKAAARPGKPVAKTAKPLASKPPGLTPSSGKGIRKKEFVRKLHALAQSKAAKRKQAIRKVPKPTTAELRKRKPVTAYLGLGSNVGDREEFIEQALTLLGQTPGVRIVKRSTSIETLPEGKTNQPPFINSAVEITTALTPYELLDAGRDIEHTLGREREVEWGPRPIDIDILLYDDKVINEEDLAIPHPLMHERLFVLEPLKEIAPHAHHPVLEREIHELFEEKKMEAGEKYDDDAQGFREMKRGGGYDDFERW
jgi:2-amino-4-hydroxy-6-hydroxymethyldihydropteridine diphosphokinase